MAVFLHAAGFHTLSFDVRGHGENPAELWPISGGEFGADTLAAVHATLARPDVTEVAIAGHSMGAIGAILAAAAEPRVVALVATSGPADPYRLTRETFRIAHLPIPAPIAWPLAWLTTRVYVKPRGHAISSIDASAAIARYAGPILLAHGDDDAVVPFAHMERLARAARRARAGEPDAAPVETLQVAEGQHSWLYEDPGYRRTVAAFLATALHGLLDPVTAGDVAAETSVERLVHGEAQFDAMTDQPGGFRTLARVALPGATRHPKGLDIEAPISPTPRATPPPAR
jgi:alpha-beta hydrolase superfamily lysophospholipase